MSPKITIFEVIAYGPMSIGLFVLLLAVIFTRRPLPFLIACVAASILHFGTYAIIRGFVAYGEAWSGYGSQHNFPTRVLVSGFGLIGVLIACKILWYLGFYICMRYTGRIVPRPPSPPSSYDY